PPRRQLGRVVQVRNGWPVVGGGDLGVAVSFSPYLVTEGGDHDPRSGRCIDSGAGSSSGPEWGA
ncbi:MAG: hypothetical protein ACRCY9_18330, partial [Phycicoccus sp.]